ncbi:MAG: transglutaminase domain-containing protein [Myxococcaceae bacterium]
MRNALLACLLLVTGCASLRPVTLKAPAAQDEANARAAAEKFYSAKDVAGMKAAVASALSVAPELALSQELAAEYAWLQGNERAAVAHLITALQDSTDPDALLHLRLLNDIDWTEAESEQIDALLDVLSEQSPSHAVRAYAAARLLVLRRDHGRDFQEVEARIPGRLPLGIIGGWDNDQGKGFDAALAPETEPFNPAAEYQGMLRPLHWRFGVSAAPATLYFLSELLQPNRFAVSYATGAFKLAQPSTVELRLRTQDAFKVWVDGALVASVREVKETMFDQAVFPLQLSAGAHRVLVKTASRDGGWSQLSVRATGREGAPLEGMEILPPEQQVETAKAPVVKPVNSEELVDFRLSGMAPNSPRTQALRALWWRFVAGGTESVRSAEKYAAAQSGGFFSRHALAYALWDNHEYGRASDLMVQLSHDSGDEFTAVSSAAARLQGQQGLKQKARTALVALAASHGDVAAVHRELGLLFDQEDWEEDECDEAHKVMTLRPGNPEAVASYTACLRKLRRDDQVEQLLRAQLAITPNDYGVTLELYRLGAERGRDRIAEWAARQMVARKPEVLYPHQALAELLVRREAWDEAESELKAAMAISPDSAGPWNALAEMEYRRGKKSEAAAAWREALTRAPDDDKLANRLEFVAPEKPELWMADVPSETDLEKLVQQARALKPESEANFAYALDQEVRQFKSDGSSNSVVTQVMQSFNSDGRDALLKYNIGRARIRVAYAVDSDGRRVEPVSVRDGQVRFRSLGEKSTVVIQYRRDYAPSGVLGRNLMLSWGFQGIGEQRERSSFVLYVPKELQLHERLTGDVKKSERDIGDQRRIEWTAVHMQPAKYEPQMPQSYEVTARLHVSSVPSWDVFASWTEALFQDALRDSPEVKELAQKLFDGANDPNEKLLRLQTFMMKEIRYEQDYESMIAGVKPHPAPMVLERKYGDCKDKTVLFMTLAKLGGIETRYALIRTRDWGEVHDEVPDQQFNHVIVYVPEQSGIATGRYFDPTADALDLVTLRSDDVGTKSFVLDPSTHQWKFQTVPYQGPELNSQKMNLDVALSDDGAAAATVKATYVGEYGSAYRRLARNPDLFKRWMQNFASAIYNGSELKSADDAPNPDDVRAPAQVGISLAARNVAKKEGNELRLPLPHDVSPVQNFKLSSRKHPLVLSVPRRFEWAGTVKLAGALPSRLPEATKFESECLDYRRTLSVEKDTVKFEHALDFKCERIAPEKYGEAMKAAIDVQRLLDEDVVFSLAPPMPTKKAKGPPLTTRSAE